eukprot:9568740-Alexandrium_andersonii.AAC.1
MCKVEGRLGGSRGDLQEAKLLNRVVRWTPEGLLYEADPRHAEQLLRDLRELESSGIRGILYPGYRREASGEEAAELLDAASVRSFRAVAARANYLSLGRPDLGFAAKERCRRRAAPTTADWAGLVRLIRYLVVRP